MLKRCNPSLRTPNQTGVYFCEELFFDWQLACYCVGGLLKLIVKVDLLRKRLQYEK